MKSSRTLVAVGLGFLGLCLAAVIGLITLELSGGGHGWNSALVSGIAGLVLLPAFGVAVALYDSSAGRIIGTLVVLGMLATDAAVATMTYQEGSYFEKVWQTGSFGIIAWAVLWFGWQLAAISLLILGGLRPAGVSRV